MFARADIDDEPHRPRRSCLSVPATSERKLAKAVESGADEIVIDLEDAVAASAKDEARVAAARALAELDWGATMVSVRVNAPGTPWCHLDVCALAVLERPPASIVVPKVQGAADLAFLDRLLDGLEAGHPHRRAMATQALIETAAGVAHLAEIAACSPRLRALIVGYADLAASLQRRGPYSSPRAWEEIRELVLIAARAHQLQAIDGAHLGVAPDEEFHDAARAAAGAGFDGKWAIHPSQVEPLNEIFSPTENELVWAQSVIDALQLAERDSRAGAVALDGQMLDEALALAARRIIARSGAARNGGQAVTNNAQ